jgi:hypothetical protein
MFIVDVPGKAGMITGFSLAAKLGVSAGWPALMTYTTELYPTVIRSVINTLYPTEIRSVINTLYTTELYPTVIR